MKRKDLIIGGIILVILALGFYLLKNRSKTPELEISQSPSPSFEKELEETFKIEIPDDVEKIVLKDVTGGSATGLATRKYDEGLFTHTVIADLPNLQDQAFYQGWLIRGQEGEADYDLVSTGKLKVAKGGFILEFQSNKDYLEYQRVLITKEKVFDNVPEERLLEGSF